MAAKTFPLVIALLVPAIAWATEDYVPKFARIGAAAKPPSSDPATPPRLAKYDGPARVLDSSMCPKPMWPLASLRHEETGTTTISLHIDATGEVLSGKIVRSSGFRDLDKATLNGMQQCTYRPAMDHGKPVQSHWNMQFVWTLE